MSHPGIQSLLKPYGGLAIRLSRSKNFKRELTLRIISRFFNTIVIYLICIVVLLLFSKFILSQRTWYSSDLLYPILHWISEHSFDFSLIIFSIGFIIIFIIYWRKTLGFLDDVIHATANMYDSKDELVVLPAELKEVENQMNQIKLNLRQNERAAKEAEQRKNDLIVYLAHDLKTPLTSVIGYLTLLRDEGRISEELREKYLAISLEKAERLEELINEFFEITRFNLTNLTLDLSTVNLSRMLEQISYEFKPILADKNLTCSLQAARDIEIKCDVNKLQRVFDNLLRNAVNYSFPGTCIEITAVPERDVISLEFKNHGNTIPLEKLNRIFEQFYRLDTARTTRTGGAGLGLAIAKEILELHHGTITATSDNDIISFHITLPKHP